MAKAISSDGSGDGAVFPPGLLVGQVGLGRDGRLRTVLSADYERLEFLRVLRTKVETPITDPGSLVAPASVAEPVSRDDDPADLPGAEDQADG